MASLKIPCPKCGKSNTLEFVGEAGDNRLYSIKDAPLKVLLEVSEEMIRCHDCRASFKLAINIPAIPILCEEGYFSDEEEYIDVD